MYYISSADKLTRTARWLEKLEGGIDYLRRVVIDDHLGIVAELEAQMEYLVSTYQCEWAVVVKDPLKRARFRQFVNSEERQEEIEFIDERDQRRPANWPKDSQLALPPPPPSLDDQIWVLVGQKDLVAKDSGCVFKYGECQIAIFHTATGQWYATQNMCPHKRAFVLAQGLLGDTSGGEPYVSCVMHKKNFSLASGRCLVPGDEEKYGLMTFQVKVSDDGLVYVLLPSIEALNAVLSTKKLMIVKDSAKTERMDVLVGCGDFGCGDRSLEW
jgi:NAD(P)H-dependent nitrite reductase small subunit